MPASVLRRCLRALMPLLLGGWLLAGAVQAQPEPIKFGQIDQKDLTAEPFAQDSAAAAVVLCDFGSTSVPNGGELRFDRVTRIKILKPAGLEWANVAVLLHHDRPGYAERLTNLQGFTYNLVNGQAEQSALAPATSLLLKKNEQCSLQKFALPNVRVGSVIEFRYTLYSNYLSGFRGWEFQHSVPVRWSEYWASIPHQFNYKMRLQTKQPLAVDEPASPTALLTTYRWAMRDVPALRPEPFMTTAADYVDKISFELANYGSQDISRSWEKIDQFLLHEWELGQQLDHFNFLKADLAQLPAPTPDNALLRLAAVRALVLKAVRCTGEFSMHTRVPLRKIYLETHQGNTAEVNFLLIAALRGAGFAASPVLLSTRAHGRVRATMPETSQFNYVAAHVALADGQELVLDATDPLLPYDMLPERCLNQQGRVVGSSAGTSRWVELKPRYRRTHLQQVQLCLAPDGALSGQVHEEFGGYAGAEYRDNLQHDGDKKFAASVGQALPGWSVSAFAVANRDSVLKPLVLDYAVAQPTPAPEGVPVGTFYLAPLHYFGPERNPFRAETRQFPVDFGYLREETITVSLTLPAGYALAETPKSKALDLPDNGGRFACSTTANGTAVQLTSRLLLRKPIYTAAEYAGLRELFRQMLEKQAERLVIRKVG
ncbi:DUF3857 domain-containing protein [Hymenobacter ruricola]|uniref:DUF3857 domain-containing protein n=1 Tax=Hymenobacter ruricola TaxID=2791023 RepID=A0ABS0I6B0_9BACT|nr:DUF3857 domain-containing protein [Hymenobacter ruricola]MBF9222223.1 DUF3857 domain-containing protein [Hymenobacter ruricola]